MFETIKNKWVTSFLIVLFSFALVCLFLFPIYNSGDDVFFLYTLAGGYGEPPTNLLHYNYGWHPALGWVIKSLFEVSPGINWYTIFLLSIQITGCVILLYILLQRVKLLTALLFYMVFFFFIEIRILLSLNFSSSAWVLATAGFMLLLEGMRLQRNFFCIISATVLLILAGMLRLHILIAVGILLIPAFLLYAAREFRAWATVLALIAGLLFLLNIQHKDFYKRNIPGWQQQEQYRQLLFKLANQSENKVVLNRAVYADTIVQAFYKARFFADTGFMSIAKLKKLEVFIKKESKFNSAVFFDGLYWLFIELRVYLLLLAISLYFLWQSGTLKLFLLRMMLPFFGIVGAYFFLALFYKMTFTLHMGFIIVCWIYSVIALHECSLVFSFSKPRSVYFLLLLLPFVWIGVRIVKTDKENRSKNQKFKCVVKEFEQNADKLFVAMDDLLPVSAYSIWDSPSSNRITNLIYKDRLITFSFQPTMERFGIKDIMPAILTNSKVVLVGNELPELRTYFQLKYRVETELVKATDTYKCFDVRYVSCKSGCEKFAEIFK
jgi:hypothetical protein